MTTINPYTNRFDFGGKWELDGDLVSNIIAGSLSITPGLRAKEAIIDNGQFSGEVPELDEQLTEIAINVRLAQDLATGTPVPTIYNRLRAAGVDGMSKLFASKFYFRRGRNSTVGWAIAFSKVFVPTKSLQIMAGRPSDLLNLKLFTAEADGVVTSETF